jgi:predicted RNase H-like nuclease (RuvC/YqgF family)
VENVKLPITIIGVVILQIGGFIWWTAQQAATIADLEETVNQLGSKMAIEDNVNLKRDVKDAFMEIEYLWDELDELWEDHDNLARTIGAITALQQRVALLENELKYINRDHEGMFDMKGSME